MNTISSNANFDRVYKINPHLKVIRITNNEIMARHSARSAFSRTWCDTGRTGLIGKLIGHMDGDSSLGDLVERGIVKETEVEDAQSIIDELRDEDILIEPDNDLVAVYLRTIYQAERPFTQSHVGIIGCGQAGSRIARHFAAVKIQKITLCDDVIVKDPIIIQRMLGIDPIYLKEDAPLAECLAKSLAPYGVDRICCVTEDSLSDDQIKNIFEECDFVVVALDEYLSSVLHRVNEHVLNADKPWASVVMDGSEGIVGPIYIPGDTCCFNEFEQQGLATAGTFIHWRIVMNEAVEIPKSMEQKRSAKLLDMWDQLEPENKTLLNLIIKRLLYRQEQGKKTDELTLALEGQKQDMASGKEALRKALFNDKPSYTSSGGDENVEHVSMPTEHRFNEESFLKLVLRRKSSRDYTSDSINLQDISTILFLSYGIRLELPVSKDQPIPYFLNSPSGGGLMSVQLYFVAMNIANLKRGLYKFDPASSSLELISHGEVRGKMYELCSYQDWVAQAGGVFVLVSDLDRLNWKYENRSYRLTHLDAGVLGQSLHLAATSVGLGSSMLFGFFDDDMNQFIGVDGDRQFVSLLLPVGNPVPDYSLLTADSAKDPKS